MSVYFNGMRMHDYIAILEGSTTADGKRTPGAVESAQLTPLTFAGLPDAREYVVDAEIHIFSETPLTRDELRKRVLKKLAGDVPQEDGN